MVHLYSKKLFLYTLNYYSYWYISKIYILNLNHWLKYKLVNLKRQFKLISSWYLSVVIQQKCSTGLHNNIFTGTPSNTNKVVYLEAVIEALLTARAMCLSIVKQERRHAPQLGNPNTTECALSFLLSFSFFLQLHITMSHDFKSGISLCLSLPPSLLCQVWKSSDEKLGDGGGGE